MVAYCCFYLCWICCVVNVVDLSWCVVSVWVGCCLIVLFMRLLDISMICYVVVYLLLAD